MKSPLSVNVKRVDARRGDLHLHLDALRNQWSPRGDVVSEAGRQKTIEVFGAPLTPVEVVQKICDDVRQRGTEALLEYSQQLDGVQMSADQLRVAPAELVAAHQAADPDFLATIRQVRENVQQFQRAILHQDVQIERPEGVVLRQRYRPIPRAGLCVPGGAAAYPSTVLMTAVPAQVAGVRELAVVAPPTEFGANNPDVLATCHELGIDEVYRVGGAQAVAALAHGTAQIPVVDKIVGPGNLFVALAKKHVYGDVDIDSIAGPSEIVLIADRSARPDYCAADLLAQAEHAPGASILVTWDSDLLEATASELARQVAVLSRSKLTIDSLEAFGALILCRDPDQACEITNQLAPEHLHIATETPLALADRLDHAGAIFLGHHTPVALGDYVAGPSHVLPTGGTARWASGLSANQFLKTSSLITYTPDALAQIAPHVQRLADKELLTAHRASVDIRLPPM